MKAVGKIEWATKAVKHMRRLTAPVRERVVAKIEQYAADPASLANNEIQLAVSKYRRRRFGSYRVLFIDEINTITVLVVLRVRHRSETND